MNWDYYNHYWNYSRYNYCVICRLKYDKGVLYCNECNNRNRTKPRYKMGQREHKRI